MSNVRELKPLNDCYDSASLWIAKLDKGLSKSEEQELRIWLSSGEQNHRVFMDMAKLWDQMDALSNLADICPDAAKQPSNLKRYTWPIAASVLLAITTALWTMSNGGPSNSTAQTAPIAAATVYETAVGEQSTHQLVDGTQIVLNTNSLIRIHITSRSRVVELERGEIHVSVAHDPSRPFYVMAEGKVVQAVGTEFNVEITSDKNIELVVTEGVVMIGILDAASGQLPRDQPIILTPTSTLVAAGRKLSSKPCRKILMALRQRKSNLRK